MSAKRSRIMGRSSSSSGFNNFQRFKNIEPPRVASKPRPSPSPNPVIQKQTNKTVIPLNPVKVGPRPSIFSIAPPPSEDCRERDDGAKLDFWATCSHCKREISEVTTYMYGYLQAFCSPECRDKRIAMDEKTRKPSPVQLKRNIKPISKRAL